MVDLFENEQKILDEAMELVTALQNGAPCDKDAFIALAGHYRSLLRQLRRVTKISDRTTVDLNTSNTDLLDRVHYDALTDIYNQRFLEESLRRIVRSLSRSGEPLSVLMLDIDYFERFNAAYGRKTADECLKTIASALCDSVFRADDLVARYESDRFVIVLPGTNEDGAHHMANRILTNARACNIPHEKNDCASYVTVSIGVVTDTAKRKQVGETYVGKAGEALDIAKQNGRNRYAFLPLNP